MIRLLSVSIIFLCAAVQVNAQSFAVNSDGTPANATAMLDVKSTTKGMLIPRMTKLQRTTISSPADGLLIYQSGPDSVGFYFYQATVGWTWLANAAVNNAWLLGGNSGTNPASNFIGTTDFADLVLKAGGGASVRLSANAMTGLYESSPQYMLDATLNAAGVFPCFRNGLRMKNTGTGNACDNGLFLGYNSPLSQADMSLWNYGNNGGGAINMIFGMNGSEVMRINNNAFVGMGSENNPQYNLDLKINAAGIFPCNRNGIRINPVLPGNNCNFGLFMGYDNAFDPANSSIWNFGNNGFGNGYTLRFGLGSDFSNGEKMRITYDGVGFGTSSPLAKIHIIDKTAVNLPGVMVTGNALPPLSYGFYSGLKDNTGASTARIWNYQNANIEIGTNDLQRMTIYSSGNVGIANSSPTATSTLQVDGTVAVGISSGISGGGSGFPVSLANLKSYVALNPSPGIEYYQLPDPFTCVGRIYYIRNMSGVSNAQLGTAAGVICPGNGNCLGAGAWYQLNFSGSSKTIICISDGSNWTVGSIN